MKQSFLSRLRTNGVYYITGALFLLLVIPLYQLFVLVPMGYGNALTATGDGLFAAYLTWIGAHSLQFFIYRIELILAFALLVSFPFTLFRIIVAQEIIGRQELQEEEAEEDDTDEEGELAGPGTIHGQQEEQENAPDPDAMPADAWRGKGFAVLAAWSGFLGLLIYLLGTIASTIYLLIIGNDFTTHTAPPDNFSTFSGIFSITTNTVGIGLLALSTLFFGAIIGRSGHRLWPWNWAIFGYAALAVAALFSGSAVAVASSPLSGQSTLTSPAILLFALWMLWFGIMLVRLKAEP